MISYGSHIIDQKDIDGVVGVLKSDWLTQGPKVKEFEEKLAKYCGVKYAVAVSNGTAALHLAYLAAGIGKGDEVITTPNTFVATTNMLLILGAKPVFTDIRKDTYNILETDIEKYITKKIKAIVPVHFAGAPCDMNTILKIAQKHNLLVIEDACHALGASYKGIKVGNLKSDMTVMSFHPVKSITTGEGGAVLTNNENFYKKLLLLRSHGITKDEKGFNVMTELGYNYRMTDIQASLGITQLKKLDGFIKKRRQVVLWYEEILGDCKNIILPVTDPNSANHIYVIRTKRKEDRLPLYNFMRNAGIGVNFHYPAIYSHPYYRARGYATIKRKMTDLYHKTSITIPLHTKLEKKDVWFVANTIKKFFNKI